MPMISHIKPFLIAFLISCTSAEVIAQAKRPLVVGYLAVASEAGGAEFFSAFRQGMQEQGWKEGTDFHIEARWANSEISRLEGLAKDIATKKPDVVVAAPSPAVLAASKVMPNVPIVQANGGDPVESRVAASYARPGGMITGVTNVIGDLSEKNLELLKTVLPQLQRIGFLYEPNRLNESSRAGAERAVHHYKLQASFAEASSPGDLEPALFRLAKEGVQALVILSGSFFPSERKKILRLAAAHRWPVVGGLREYAEEGALISYGADRKALYRRSAHHVDRILKGTHPKDLPFEQPTTFQLTLNLNAARALGIKIPNELLLRADDVIK